MKHWKVSCFSDWTSISFFSSFIFVCGNFRPFVNLIFNHNSKFSEYLTRCMETVLYFTIPEEDFACIPLRMFLSTLLANVVCKPVIDMLSEPDFINLQVAKSVRQTMLFDLIGFD